MAFQKSGCRNIRLLLLVAVSFLASCASTIPEPPSVQSGELSDRKMADSAAKFKDEFGIEIVALRQSAAGHMLDFRFRVVDLEKSMPFFSKEIKPYVLDEKSGKSLGVPVPAKLGPMRPTGRNPKLGITYWMFFGNEGLVESGDRVTLVVGDYRIEHLLVE